MAIPEACGVWIEQRVQEELDRRGDTGASLRAIGRQVAAEVEKYFETKVNPDAIRMRASRIETGTNVQPKSNPQKEQQLPQTPRLTNAGGKREGAGRKPRPIQINEHATDLDWDRGIDGVLTQMKYVRMSIDELVRLPQWRERNQEVTAIMQGIITYINDRA